MESFLQCSIATYTLKDLNTSSTTVNVKCFNLAIKRNENNVQLINKYIHKTIDEITFIINN